MSITVFAIVLFAALFHATWNAIVAGAGDKLLTAILVVTCSATISALTLPFLPPPAPASWPNLAASTVLQVSYQVLLANAYRTGEMSRAYPIMRGTAPMIVAIVSAVFLAEALSVPGWFGIALVSLGILSLTFAGRGTSRTAGTRFALANAVVIASYTLVDGAGVRASGSPAAYTMWLSLLAGTPMAVWALLYRRADYIALLRSKLHLGIVGGIGTITSYGLALWAMTEAPIPLVAALRETSILWATAIAGIVLRERIGPVRLVAVGFVAIGAIILRVA